MLLRRRSMAIDLGQSLSCDEVAQAGMTAGRDPRMQSEEAAMPAYTVNFYNTLSDGTGRQRKVRQRSIAIAEAPSPEAAIEQAKVLFMVAERVARWDIRAQFAEAEPSHPPPATDSVRPSR